MTSKTISTTVPGFKFTANDTQLTITATGKIAGASPAAVYAGPTRTGESILNLGKVGDSSSALYGILMKDGATITNGSATDKTAAIAGSSIGIRIDGKAGAVTNFGAISASQKAIAMFKGGTITNGSAADTTASITSTDDYAAIDAYDGAGKVTNFGTIKGQVNLYDGGTIVNGVSGQIINREAIYLGGTGNLTNLGTISGQVKFGSGQVVNGSKTDHTAFIGAGGGNYGVNLGTGTLTNYGTISGTEDAVAMQNGTVMIAEAGSKLLGGPSYGQGATLVFGAGGGAGTIIGLGTGSITGSTTEKFRDLTTYQIQAGGKWTLSGATNTLKAADSLSVLGTLSLAGSLKGAGKLSIGKTGVVQATAAGAVEIVEAITNAGVLIASGGTLTLDKAVTGAGTARISKGTLAASGTFAESVQFTGTTGTLDLAHAKTYAGSVSGFSKTGTTSLDLRDVKFVSASEAKFVGTATGGTLTVSDGTSTAKIKLTGNYTGVTFKAASDGHGGTKVVGGASALTSTFVDAIAAMGAGAGGSTPPRHDPAPTTTLLAHPRG